MQPDTAFWSAFIGQAVVLGGLIARLSWLVATMSSDIMHNAGILKEVKTRLDSVDGKLNGISQQAAINREAIMLLGRRVDRVEEYSGTPKPPGYGQRGKGGSG